MLLYAEFQLGLCVFLGRWWATMLFFELRISQQKEHTSFPLHNDKPSPENSFTRSHKLFFTTFVLVAAFRTALSLCCFPELQGTLRERDIFALGSPGAWSLAVGTVSSSQSELTTVAGRFLLVARLIVQGKDSCFKDITLRVVILARRSLFRF